MLLSSSAPQNHCAISLSGLGPPAMLHALNCPADGSAGVSFLLSPGQCHRDTSLTGQFSADGRPLCCKHAHKKSPRSRKQNVVLTTFCGIFSVGIRSVAVTAGVPWGVRPRTSHGESPSEHICKVNPLPHGTLHKGCVLQTSPLLVSAGAESVINKLCLSPQAQF